jgi:hypothetical protein
MRINSPTSPAAIPAGLLHLLLRHADVKLAPPLTSPSAPIPEASLVHIMWRPSNHNHISYHVPSSNHNHLPIGQHNIVPRPHQLLGQARHSQVHTGCRGAAMTYSGWGVERMSAGVSLLMGIIAFYDTWYDPCLIPILLVAYWSLFSLACGVCAFICEIKLWFFLWWHLVRRAKRDECSKSTFAVRIQSLLVSFSSSLCEAMQNWILILSIFLLQFVLLWVHHSKLRAFHSSSWICLVVVEVMMALFHFPELLGSTLSCPNC